MRIAVVSTFYSREMGYTENALPRSLATLGHDVRVVSSDMNVYANLPKYDEIYRDFLGERRQPLGTFEERGFSVTRLPHTLVGGYVRLRGLGEALREFDPEIVHVTEIASLQAFRLASLRPRARWRLFAETHQHMSVVKPYLLKQGRWGVKASYYATRTLPTSLASRALEKCYAIAPDCLEVAARFYGVPRRKLKLLPLGTDLTRFTPASDQAAREELRAELGILRGEVVFIYTGRFSLAKNPLLLARAVAELRSQGHRAIGLFVGAGEQGDTIAGFDGSIVMPFASHGRLADYYRMADVAVWPTQESMSMLDAAASGLPLIVSDRIGEPQRVEGSGTTYLEGDLSGLMAALSLLMSKEPRRAWGEAGRRKMEQHYDWQTIAAGIVDDYRLAIAR